MVDFVDLVSNYTELSVENGHIFGDCPFCHAEKGMHINPEKGLYYCFKCKESGNSVLFAMKKESLNYKEALAWLGEKYCKYDRVKETYKEYQKQLKERGKA
jgi:DNA primase